MYGNRVFQREKRKNYNNNRSKKAKFTQVLSNMQHLFAPLICDKTNTDGGSNFEIVWYHAFVQPSHTFLSNHGSGSVPSATIFILHTGHACNLHSSPQNILNEQESALCSRKPLNQKKKKKLCWPRAATTYLRDMLRSERWIRPMLHITACEKSMVHLDLQVTSASSALHSTGN